MNKQIRGEEEQQIIDNQQQLDRKSQKKEQPQEINNQKRKDQTKSQQKQVNQIQLQNKKVTLKKEKKPISTQKNQNQKTQKLKSIHPIQGQNKQRKGKPVSDVEPQQEKKQKIKKNQNEILTQDQKQKKRKPLEYEKSQNQKSKKILQDQNRQKINKKSQQIQKPADAQNSQDQKRKKMFENIKRQMMENKKRWMPFVRFMKKHGLKFKTARYGKTRIQYFRLKDIRQVLQQNKSEIQKNANIKQLAQSWQKQVVFFQRPENIPRLKYPKQLQRSEDVSKAKFASFKFDPTQPKTWLLPLILTGIIAVVLFPLWPYILKYSIFMICLVLVTLVLSTIILRLIVYLFFAMFGMSFWILPNFFADCSFAQSFIPVYESKKWQGGIFNIIGRLIALYIFAYYGYQLYIDSSWVYQNIEITKTSFDDLHDWGVSKIKGQKNFSQSALTNLQHIMNQTADFNVDQSLDLQNIDRNLEKPHEQNPYIQENKASEDGQYRENQHTDQENQQLDNDNQIDTQAVEKNEQEINDNLEKKTIQI